MNKAPWFIILIVFVLTVAGIAYSSESENYIIKKGDTLWDITGDKFNDQFLWPSLWKANPQIDNPDLIFPGDIIIIPSLEELRRLMGIAEEMPAKKPVPAPLVVIPEEVPKYILEKDRFISSGWIAAEYPGVGEVISSPTNRTVFGIHDPVYLKSDEQVSVGDRFYTIRKIKKVKHPRTRKFLGYQVRITGIAEVVGMDGRNEDVPKAMIRASYENIHIGEGLMPYTEMEPPLVPDEARTPLMDGYIVETYMNNNIVSAGDIVYLDKGGDDNIQVGDTFSALFQTPVERSIGTIQVFSLQPTTSVALILKSDQEVTIGDMWGNR